MFCQHCGAGLAPGAADCPACGRRLSGIGMPRADDATEVRSSGGAITEDASHESPTIAVVPADKISMMAASEGDEGPPVSSRTSSSSLRSTAISTGGSGPLAAGSAFGPRYHIIRLLGMGGMGAVYQAWDDALGVTVALKVVRPEISADAAAARDLERRFKRELLLARQVTHKNVVRIHDLGEIDGIKYLTMPYIQGNDLGSILTQERKLPVARAVAIAKQVADGLQAAHDAGVVHRDLKPANIMVDADDQAVIMDFGIARSVSGGVTMAGAVVGTLEYMAPEQALARPVDHRADLYAFGLILYDMVLGPRDASRAESAVADLMARVQKPLVPARSIDASIPESLERIIDRCTQPDPAARYQSTRELVDDLALIDTQGRQTGTASLSAPPVTRPKASHSSAATRALLKYAAAAAVVLAVAVGAWLLRERLFSPPRTTSAGPERAMALAVLPFRNATGNADLDWLGQSLADMVGGSIGQSSRLRLVSQDRMFQLLRDLRVGPNAEIDVGTIRSVMEFASADKLVSGSFGKLGEQIRIDLRVHHARGEPTVLSASAGENDMVRAAQNLAQQIRNSLSLDAATVSDLQAKAFTPSSQSAQALRYYTEGTQLARQGEHQEAIKRFDQATQADPNFSLAFASLAQALSTAGRSGEAEQASRQAVSLSAPLPAEEREMVSAAHASITGDIDAAIASYERLVESRPGDVQLRSGLAGLLENKGALDRARDEYVKVLETDPKYVDALLAAGRVAIRRRDYQKSLEWLNTAQSLTVQLDNQQAKANVLQYLGIAYKNLRKLDDALRHYEESLAIKRQINDQRGIAASLNEIGQVHDLKGRPDLAVPSYQESVAIRRDIGDRRGVGTVLISLGASYLDSGKLREALETFREALQIHRDLGDEERQARCLSNIGNVYVVLAQYDDARTYLERALELREKLKVPGTIAITLTSLADVSAKLGDYERALQQYLRAIELSRSAGDRRGAALVSFAIGTLREQQGRYGAALEAKGEALKTFRELQDRSPTSAEILLGYGYAQSLAGRTDEAETPLGEALKMARELKNRSLVAQALNAQGENAFHRGDLKLARALFEQAQQEATRAESVYLMIVLKLNAAKVAAEDGRASAALTELTKIRREADDLGLKQLSAESSLHLGAALLRAGRAAEARKELEDALRKAERLGSLAVLARSHYILAEALRVLGRPSEATPHQRQAEQILDEMRKEARTDALLTRHDLRFARQSASR